MRRYQKGACTMGRFVNPDNSAFQVTLNSEFMLIKQVCEKAISLNGVGENALLTYRNYGT